MKIAVAGIGGVGGVVGGALARTHEDTYFYVRGENLNAICQDGLNVRSVLLGDFIARPKLASDNANDFGVMDAVIVSCKGYSLNTLCKSISPMVGPETVVIPLLNGVIVSDIMKSMLPPCILTDGTVKVFSRLEKPGHIIQSFGKCNIVFGMKDGSCPQIFNNIAEILNNAEILTTLSDNILLDSWKKYSLMCGNSVVFCYYDGPAGKVRKDPNHTKVLRAVVEELVAVAKARGVALPKDTADKYVGQFPSFPDDTTTSLYRDLASGKNIRHTELDHIIGRMVELGCQANVPTPYHKIAYEKFAGKS